jgi:pSer/pThr/pTyr-binding forkhead associated (FHA) protein
MDVTLVMFKEDGTRRDFAMERDSIVIGRSGDCDFQIPLAVVSRRHCKVSRKGGRLVVKDLGSSNGTYLNNQRVLQAEAKAGDVLRVGPVIFTIVVDGKPSEVEPVVSVLEPKKEAKEEKGDLLEASGSGIALAGPSEKSAGETDGSMDLADLGPIEMDEGSMDLAPGDSAAASPLAELEALAKQRKK